MSKGKSGNIRYKPYEQYQTYLIPPSTDELIPEKHLVRLVSDTIDEMGIEPMVRKYRVGGGASRYHPVMMTKVFVYGYMTKVCSSRMLAKAVRENVMYQTKVRCGWRGDRNRISGRSMSFGGNC
jgi:transposase